MGIGGERHRKGRDPGIPLFRDLRGAREAKRVEPCGEAAAPKAFRYS